MNQKRIISALDHDPIIEYLENNNQIETHLQQLTKLRRDARNNVDSALNHALSEICASGKYSILEKAAFSAVFDSIEPAKNLDDLTERVGRSFERLLSINQTLRKIASPLLAYTVCRMPKTVDFRPSQLIEYSYRHSDGSGLVIDERILLSGAEERPVYDVYIPEMEAKNNKHARRFGMTYHDEPLIFGRSPNRLLDWADGPKNAADDLSDPPRNKRTTHILIGDEEIHNFFELSRSSEQYDTLFGHVALMRLHYADEPT